MEIRSKQCQRRLYLSLYFSLKSKKGFLFLLCFIPLFLRADDIQSSIIIQKAIEKKSYDSHVWHRLIHLDKNNKPSINTPSFLISHDDFTPKNELFKTINSFFEDNKSMCKYPARLYWLKNELDLKDSIFPASRCDEFDEYIEKTNPNNLKLVFVSEQVKNPSSMMGHTFFKLEGNDGDGARRQNAVSFFTVIDTFNIPYLMVKSTITGMKGFFILSPYQSQVHRYLNEEDRNIWEYDLNLSELQKKIIYYHFWELKDIDITYLFTGFNCATIVDDMLAITDISYKENSSLWITPKDVIKKANTHKLLNRSVLIPSKTWELNMLTESIPSPTVNTIQNMIFNKNYNQLHSYNYSKDEKDKQLEVLLINTYTDYLQQDLNILSKDEALQIHDSVPAYNNDLSIDLTNYKNPLKTFDDSQLSFGYQETKAGGGLKIGFLPASNTLYDDNREYFSESSLKIGEFAFIIDKNKISIDTLNVFAMKSLIPWNSLTQNFSTDFKFNYEKHYTSTLDEFHAINISGGIGINKKIHDDMSLFGLFDIGFAYGNNAFYPYVYPQLGLMIYEIFNMKSTFEYQYLYNQDNANTGYHNFNMEQSFYIDKKYRIGASYNRKLSANSSFETLGISFNYFF